MLWPKSEEDDAAFAHRDFGERDLVLDLIFTTQPAGPEYFVFRVACDDVNFIAIGCFERGAVDEVGVGVFRHCSRDLIRRVHVEPQNRAWAVKIG